MVRRNTLTFISTVPPFNQFSDRLPKIKGWIDEHNPGDPLIPFSVALEERLAPLAAEEKDAEQKLIGAPSALGKIMQAGYASLEVGYLVYLSQNTAISFGVAAHPLFHLRSR